MLGYFFITITFYKYCYGELYRKRGNKKLYNICLFLVIININIIFIFIRIKNFLTIKKRTIGSKMIKTNDV